MMDENKESVMTIDGQGNKIWKNERDKLHRLDGPAVEQKSGNRSWYLNGKLHRLDGPAVEWADGGKEWWVNGKRHRPDGPAIERAFGHKEWWINGQLMTKEEWEEKALKREVDSSGNVCWRNVKGELHRLDGPAFEWANGGKEWRVNNKRHRLNGPAVEWASGTKEWWKNGKRHREDGPAVEWVNGGKEWWVNGQRHREDGPAVEWVNGGKEWWVNDKRHRLDGPAVERADGTKEWWLNGQMMTKDEVTRTFNTKKNIPFVKGTPENVFKAAKINGWKVYSHLKKNIYFSCDEENFEKVNSLLND